MRGVIAKMNPSRYLLVAWSYLQSLRRYQAARGIACGVPEPRQWPLACSFLNHPVIFNAACILVDQPAEDPATPYLRCREIEDDGRSNLGSASQAQVPGQMRTMLVVTRDVLIQDRVQVPRPAISASNASVN
jgi:hypothetical protein